MKLLPLSAGDCSLLERRHESSPLTCVCFRASSHAAIGRSVSRAIMPIFSLRQTAICIAFLGAILASALPRRPLAGRNSHIGICGLCGSESHSCRAMAETLEQSDYTSVQRRISRRCKLTWPRRNSHRRLASLQNARSQLNLASRTPASDGHEMHIWHR